MHMGVVSLLIALFFGTILLAGYYALEQNTDNRADMLWARRAAPPGTMVSSYFAVRPAPAVPAGMNLRTQAVPGIYVVTDENRAVAAVESAYEMDEAFYAMITRAAFAKPETDGKLRVENIALKYRRTDREVLFIDVTGEAEMFAGMAYSLLLIALPLLAVIFGLSLFFANRSIRPIEKSYNRQKEFIADASHELKTPLAAISANLEALHGADEAGAEKWLGYIQSEVGRLNGLASSLLYLAKTDDGGDAGIRALPVDISRLFTDIWLPLEAVLFEKGIAAETDITPGVCVRGDEEQLRRLFGILTDNALRYAAGRIRVTLSKTPHHAVFAVANDGPGIPAGDRDKIWERFYRCDHSRRYDGGYGLGLSMARAVTERHRGRISCESEPDAETVFTVRLPL